MLKTDKVVGEHFPVLYRGHSQGAFECRVLGGMIDGNKPHYFGYEDSKDGEITFFDIYLIDGIFHANRLVESGEIDVFKNGFFSEWPIIMQIESKKFKDRLYYSTEGEGVVVRGPIDLGDIEILYSSHINKLEKMNAHPQTNDNVKTTIAHLEQFCEKRNLSKEDTLVRFERDPDATIEKLCLISYGLPQPLGYNGEQKEKIKNFLNILKQKLR